MKPRLSSKLPIDRDQNGNKRDHYRQRQDNRRSELVPHAFTIAGRTTGHFSIVTVLALKGVLTEPRGAVHFDLQPNADSRGTEISLRYRQLCEQP
jgi:hypothetical protein